MNRSAQMGFTLLELLIGMALTAIILVALLNFFTQGSTASTQASSRAELQQEVLNAQQLIAGKLKEAWYVYPAGQTITMTSTALTKRPGGNNTWTVGTDPILAMVLPPRTSTLTCATTTTTTQGPDGCYRFLAYYPVKRSEWVTGTGTDSWRNPGPDAANAETWVLAEYRATMPTTFVPPTYPPSAAPTVPSGSQANILSDYIAPTVATTGFTTSASTYTMFTYISANGAATSTTNPVVGVTLDLATTRKTTGATLRLPDATNEYSITIYPTNLGKIAAN